MSSSAGKAPFEVIADKIRREIRDGTLKPGDKLQTHRELVAKYGKAVGTIQNALRLLQDEGLLISRQSIGVFVSEAAPRSDQPVTLEQLAQELAALRERVEQLEQR